MSVERGNFERESRRRTVGKLRKALSPTAVCCALLGGILGSGVGGVLGGIGGAAAGGVAGQLLDRGEANRLETKQNEGEDKL